MTAPPTFFANVRGTQPSRPASHRLTSVHFSHTSPCCPPLAQAHNLLQLPCRSAPSCPGYTPASWAPALDSMERGGQGCQFSGQEEQRKQKPPGPPSQPSQPVPLGSCGGWSGHSPLLVSEVPERAPHPGAPGHGGGGARGLSADDPRLPSCPTPVSLGLPAGSAAGPTLAGLAPWPRWAPLGGSGCWRARASGTVRRAGFREGGQPAAAGRGPLYGAGGR